jgi:formate dehydrogenase major subunit
VNTGGSIDIGSNVVVVGGGNTAIDAARASRRKGANVTLLYRRTRSEMPAIEHEINEAEEEGVRFEFLMSPVEIRRNASEIEIVVAQRMRLGKLDDSGRQRPIPIDGSYIEIKASSLVAAISQEPDWTSIHDLHDGEGWMEATADGYIGGNRYAGGDVRGLGLAARAIGHGRAAAEKAHAGLRGLKTASFLSQDRSAGSGKDVKLDFYEGKDRIQVEHTVVEDRLKNSALEVSQTVEEAAFLQEASRCLSCESCFGCQHCWMYCNAQGFSTREDPEPGSYFKLDLSICEGCGKCIDVCPSGFLHPLT